MRFTISLINFQDRLKKQKKMRSLFRNLQIKLLRSVLSFRQLIKGNLDKLLPLLDDDAVNRAIRIGACNIYHGCVHNMLHGRSDEILRALYKSAAFVVQAICFRQTGTYISPRPGGQPPTHPGSKLAMGVGRGAW